MTTTIEDTINAAKKHAELLAITTSSSNPESFKKTAGVINSLLALVQPRAVELPEPIVVEAVAEVYGTGEGMDVRSLLEGGFSDMSEGDILIWAHSPITDDEGRGEVLTPDQVHQLLAAERQKSQDVLTLARGEFELLESILKGWPSSLARADGLRGIHAAIAAIDKLIARPSKEPQA